jgi:thrombospondin type 3 repeat protein
MGLLQGFPLHAQGAPAPVRFERFTDPGLFSPEANVIGFRGLPEGTPIDEPMGVYGLSVSLQRGLLPTVWVDREPRAFPPPSAAALCNLETREGRTKRTDRIRGANEIGLVANFQLPVNRIGFELRRIDPGRMNVVLRAFSGGHEIGSQFFDADETFRFLGVQSSQPFDELRVEFTNPSQVTFSLDNFAHELDLRDRDRDGQADFIDTCADTINPDQLDTDGDGLGDACDAFPYDEHNDADDDGLGQEIDNCPRLYNPDQQDSDGDGLGDGCDAFFGTDTDGDAVADGADNCPQTFNPEQADCDLDGVGDVCDATLIDPPAVSFTLQRGECVTVQKSVCLPPAPPAVDVLILFDTTGSMGGEIRKLRANVIEFVNGVRGSLPQSDVRFGLASFRDYPGEFGTCSYLDNYGLPTDQPFTVDAPLGSSNEEVVAAVDGLLAFGGEDPYESYGRALWEVSQPDSGIGFRSGAARFVLLVGDAGAHDCNLGALLGGCVGRFSSGRDPGRDGLPLTADDIDFQEDALAGLVASRTTLLMMYTGFAGFCAWESWCEGTGGRAVRASPDGTLPPSVNLVDTLVEMIRDPVVNRVSYSAQSTCGLGVTFDPPLVTGPIDVSNGSQIGFRETICVPADLPAGVTSIDCSVEIFADEVLLGVQTIHVDVGCELVTLDFETPGDGVTPLVNGQGLPSPTEFDLVRLSSAGPNLGLAVFDSTPGGPNDPSINADLLVGHGNLLLLQDTSYPQLSAPGVFRRPTDDPQGGDMILSFPGPVDPRSLLLVDINPPPNLGCSVTLVDQSNRTRVYAVDPGWTGTYGNAGPWRLDLTTLLPQPGNGTPRWARATEQPGFKQDDVVRIVVHMTGNGAIDELVFCH